MANLTVTDEYDALLSTTLRNYRRKLEDNIFKKNPLLFWLNDKGRKKMEDGGYKIITPLMYGTNSTAKAYSRYDLLDTTPQEGITAAEYPWKQVAVSIAIDRLSERQNSGPHRLVNLLESKIQQAELSLQALLTTHLLANPDNIGTPFGEGDEEISSLWHFVRLNNDASTTVGGIDPSVETWWQNISSWELKGADQSIDWDASTPAADGLNWWMSNVYNTCADGNDYPDLILCCQEAYQVYEALLQPLERFTDTRVGDAGFQNLKFRAGTMIYDKEIPGTIANNNAIMAFLNSDYLWWVVDRETDFYTTPFMRPEQQDARVAQILLYGNLVCSQRRRQGVLEIGDGT